MERTDLIRTVEQAQSGDEAAYQVLYIDTYKSVFYLALRMVKNREDAEDITQEVLITVHEKISELREPAAFYKWVNQITANKCAAFLRKHRGTVNLDDDEEVLKFIEDDPLNLPDKAIDDEDTRKIILEVIDALPDGQRACVMFYYYQQLTISQISDLLEINENTVKSRLALARAKIRAALEEKEKKEGIKLYGIPLALTPILRQAMEAFEPPEGLAERLLENVSQAVSNPLGVPPDMNGGTSDQLGPKPEGISEATSQAASAAGTEAAATGMAVATKIIIGVISAAVVIAGAIVLPPLLSSPDEAPPPAVTDTQITDDPEDGAQTYAPGPEQSELSEYDGLPEEDRDLLNENANRMLDFLDAYLSGAYYGDVNSGLDAAWDNIYTLHGSEDFIHLYERLDADNPGGTLTFFPQEDTVVFVRRGSDEQEISYHFDLYTGQVGTGYFVASKCTTGDTVYTLRITPYDNGKANGTSIRYTFPADGREDYTKLTVLEDSETVEDAFYTLSPSRKTGQ